MQVGLEVGCAALLLSVASAVGGPALADTYSFDTTPLQPYVSSNPTLYITGSFTFQPHFTRPAPSLTVDFDIPDAVSFQIFEDGKLIRSLTDQNYFIYGDGISNAGLGYILGLAPNGNLDALGDSLFLSYVPNAVTPISIQFGTFAFPGGYIGYPSLTITTAVPEPSSFALVIGGIALAGGVMLSGWRRVKRLSL